MENHKYTNLFLIIVIFFISFIPRIYKISQAPIYPDEITWMVRAKETFLAVRTLNKQHILNYFKSSNAWWNIKNDTEAISLPLVSLTGPFIAYLGIGQGVLTRNVLPDFVAARIPLVFINSFTAVLLYLLAEKVLGRRVAILASVFYALDPISISNSRLVMNDSLLTLFTLLTIYSFFYIKKYKWSVFLTSLGMAFAFLTKPIGLLPLCAIVFYLFLSKSYKDFTKTIYILVLTTIFVHIFWPEAWLHPVIAIFEYFKRQIFLVQKAPELFFIGKVSNNTPVYYYLYQIAFRLPSYTFIGLFLSIIVVFIYFKRKGLKYLCNVRNYKNNSKELSIIFYVVLFFCVISFSLKKSGVRYLLPIWPFLYIISFWGISEIISLSKQVFLIVTGIVIFMAIFNIFMFNPNYDYYFNELFGGGKNANNYISTNLCYGAKESAEYINRCFPEVKQVVYIGCAKAVLPYYYKGTISTDFTSDKPTIVESYYQQMGYLDQALNKYTEGKDHITIKSNNINLATIYTNLKPHCL